MAIYIFAIFIIFWFIVSYNNFIKQRKRVNEAFDNLCIYLQKRYRIALVLNEVVKGYGAYVFTISDLEIINKVIEVLDKASTNNSKDKTKIEKELSEDLNKMIKLSDKYQELLYDMDFLSLRKQLIDTELEIEKASINYNMFVRNLNRSIEKVPGCLVASMFNLEEELYFEFEIEE